MIQMKVTLTPEAQTALDNARRNHQRQLIIRALAKRAVARYDAAIIEFIRQVKHANDPMTIDLEDIRRHWRP